MERPSLYVRLVLQLHEVKALIPEPHIYLLTTYYFYTKLQPTSGIKLLLLSNTLVALNEWAFSTFLKKIVS